MAFHSRYAVTVSAAVATRSRVDCSSMEDRRHKSLPSARRGARLHHHRVEVAGRHVPKHPDAAGGVDGCAKVVL